MAVPGEVAVVVRRSGDLTDLRWLHGAPNPGEALAETARRLLRDAGFVATEPWAVDLSATPALLAADAPDADDDAFEQAPPMLDREAARRLGLVPHVAIGFRPMTRADFPDAVRWTHQPHVARWWDDEAADLAATERHYGPALDGEDPTRRWVVELNGRSVGFVQDYRIGDHPEYALLTARPEAVGIDYLVGEAAWVGRGIGTRLLWQYLRDVVRPGYPEAPACFAAPDHRNAGSLRVLDKLGFTRGLWFDEPRRDGGVDTVVGCSLDVAAVFGRSRRHVTGG